MCGMGGGGGMMKGGCGGMEKRKIRYLTCTEKCSMLL